MAHTSINSFAAPMFTALVLALAVGVPTVSSQEPPGADKKDAPTAARVRVSEVTIHGDMDCFKIETPSATYLYGKKGAGFASIIDKDGHDWISYRPDGKAKGEYRGLPKCGQPVKYFHCGYGYGQYKTDNVFKERRSPSAKPIASGSSPKRGTGKRPAPGTSTPRTRPSRCSASTRRPFGSCTKEKTPGGRLHPDKGFTIRPDGKKSSLNEPWSEVVPWVCFGAAETPLEFSSASTTISRRSGQTDSYVSWPFEKESRRLLVPRYDGLRLRSEGT